MEQNALPDNIISKIPRVVLTNEKQSKTGNKYRQIEIYFVNGYVYKAFVNEEQLFAIKDALKSQEKSTDNVLDGSS